MHVYLVYTCVYMWSMLLPSLDLAEHALHHCKLHLASISSCVHAQEIRSLSQWQLPSCQHVPANVDSGVLYGMPPTLHGRSIKACCSCGQPSCVYGAFRQMCVVHCVRTTPVQRLSSCSNSTIMLHFRQTPAEPWLRRNLESKHRRQRQILLPCSPEKCQILNILPL